MKKKLPINIPAKYHSKISLTASIVTLILLCFIIIKIDKRITLIQEKTDAAEAKAAQEALEASTPQITTANVVAVGDNLYHSYLYESGKNDTGPWNYDHLYTEVKDIVSAADLAFIDQETIFTPDHDSVSSYPSFATPEEVGDAIVNAGFNVIETATNHTDDFGAEYIESTIQYWKQNHPDVTVIGINESQESADELIIREVNGIKIAILDYAYGSNSDIVRNSDKPWLVNYFDKERITKDLEKARENSDCIIFVAHWGIEDNSSPSEYQKQWANFLNEQGVNVIIGGHPHVLQPYETLTSSTGQETLVFYSLGNFVSTQNQIPEILGGMGKFTIEKTTLNGSSTVKISAAEVDPLVMHYNLDKNDFKVYMLSDYTEALAADHGIINRTEEKFSLKILENLFDEIMNQKVGHSSNTDLLDIIINADGTVTKSDGSILSESEATDLFSPDRSPTNNK